MTACINPRRRYPLTGVARRFEFVEESYESECRVISCDGLVPGATLDLTHWQGNRTPQRFKADTSTEDVP